MSGLTGYLTEDGTDLSYIFHPKDGSIPITQNIAYSGTNIFSGNINFSELKLSCGTITGNITLSNPMLNFYQITSTATSIALPIPTTSGDKGTFIIFKHTNTGNIVFTCAGISIVSIQSVGAATSVTLTNAAVAMIACNGSAWWVYNFASL